MIWLKVARMLPKLAVAGEVSCSSERPRQAAMSCLVAQPLWRNASSRVSFMIPPIFRASHNRSTLGLLHRLVLLYYQAGNSTSHTLMLARDPHHLHVLETVAR